MLRPKSGSPYFEYLHIHNKPHQGQSFSDVHYLDVFFYFLSSILMCVCVREVVAIASCIYSTFFYVAWFLKLVGLVFLGKQRCLYRFLVRVIAFIYGTNTRPYTHMTGVIIINDEVGWWSALCGRYSSVCRRQDNIKYSLRQQQFERESATTICWNRIVSNNILQTNTIKYMCIKLYVWLGDEWLGALYFCGIFELTA